MHRVRRIWLSNYRSCKTLSLELNPFTPLVGYNNAGKSTIVNGIIWLLAPAGEICEDDFCGNDLSNPIEITGEIIGITQDLLDKLISKHRSKIEKYVDDDGVLVIRRRQMAPGTTKKDRPLYVLKPGDPVDDDSSWDKNPTGIDAAISALFPAPIHIEAMQDASKDAAKNVAGSTLGKLLKEILGSVEEQHGKKISDAVDELGDILSAEGTSRANELTVIDASANRALTDLFPGIEVRTEITPPTIQTLFKAGTLKVRDPHRSDSWYDFDSMGHGAQRTIQMALVRCLAERGKTEDSVECRLLLIDEPELYLHPQAIEQVRVALKKLTEVGFQIIFSTHSPSLIASEDVSNTLLIRKNNDGTYVLPTMKQAAREKIHENRAQAETLLTLSNSSQILFCETVLLVEGKTEDRLLPYLYKKITGRTLGMDKIAIVPLNSSSSTKKAIDILNAMGLPHKAVVDLDFIFAHGEKSGLYSPPDNEIDTCLAYFSNRSARGEIRIGENGLPQNDPEGLSAADVYAECAVSTECSNHIKSLHERIKNDYGIWVWPVGDIERVLDVEGKNELAWARFIADIEQEGDLDGKILNKSTFDQFISWVTS